MPTRLRRNSQSRLIQAFDASTFTPTPLIRGEFLVPALYPVNYDYKVWINPRPMDHDLEDSMTLIIDLPDEIAAAMKTQAAARGLSVEDWLQEIGDSALRLWRPGSNGVRPLSVHLGS